MRFERRLRVKTAIDMTPLVDVILMLVLFFLITSTFKTAPGIQIALPSSSTARTMSEEPLRVLVVSEQEIHVGAAVAGLGGLSEAIARELARTAKSTSTTLAPEAASASRSTAQAPQSERRAIVEAGANISYQVLISVLDALRKEGIGAVGLATRTVEQKP